MVVAVVAARGVTGWAIASATTVLDIAAVDAGVFDDNMCKRRRPLRTWAGSHCVGGDYGGNAPAGGNKGIVALVAAEVAADWRRRRRGGNACAACDGSNANNRHGGGSRHQWPPQQGP